MDPNPGVWKGKRKDAGWGWSAQDLGSRNACESSDSGLATQLLRSCELSYEALGLGAVGKSRVTLGHCEGIKGIQKAFHGLD